MNRPAGKIPYAFAKANGVVLTGLRDGLAEVALRSNAPSGALAEMRRALGVPVRAHSVSS